LTDTGKEQKKSRNPNRRHTFYLININLMAAVTIAVCAAAGYLVYRLQKANARIESFKAEVTDPENGGKVYWTESELNDKIAEAEKRATGREHSTILQQIQSSLESGESTLDMLRKLFPDDLVVRNGDRYYFYTVADGVALNDFAEGDFRRDDNGWLTYVGKNSSIHTENGIDVSASEGTVEWDKVREDGTDFAYLCLGSRGSNGKIAEDSAVEDNALGASKNGIRTGIYYKLNAVSDKEAAADANYVADFLDSKGKTLGISADLPVGLTVTVPSDESRAAGQSQEDWTSHVLKFCSTLSDRGYKPMIYGNINSFTMMLDIRRLEDYDKWLSETSVDPYDPYAFTYWQYTQESTLDGIEGKVHRDLAIVTKK
jgi:lysozyme